VKVDAPEADSQVGVTEGHSAAADSLAALAVGALGIVFGDIATSPLYALQEAFGAHGVAPTSDNVMGVLSLTVWSLVLVVSIKYVVFIMRANNCGEGGSMALLALAKRSVEQSARLKWWVVTLGLVGAALFFGDSVITPAISVLSAIEGLDVATPAFRPAMVPIAIAILVALFALQRFGTSRVGFLFAPVMALWLFAIAALGIVAVVQAPGVLAALSPHYGIMYLAHNGFAGFSSLGAVVLVLTGVEALYADMGHFGVRPIRAAWFGLVLPALLLSYVGQGALLLGNPGFAGAPFYHLVPPYLLYTVVALACVATVVASQAVISGAYSMVREAVQLAYLPRLEIRHTSQKIRGQVYLPVVNGILLILVLAAVLGFRSSANLAAAFGVAVSGTMLISTLLVLVVAHRLWNWSLQKVTIFALVFVSIDVAFFASNAVKIESGAWFPLVLGAAAFTVMVTWRRGRRILFEQLRREGVSLNPFVHSIQAHPPQRVPGVAVFLTANVQVVPQALLHNLKHNKILHDQNVILTTEVLDVPAVRAEERLELTRLGGGFYRMTLRFGFAEDPNIPLYLEGHSFDELNFDPMTVTFFVSRETVVPVEQQGALSWRDKLFAFLARNAQRANTYFGIPVNRLVEIGSRVEI
jgi:KUP system potassium uptake protein